MTLTYGSLFAGYGGLEQGVQSVLGGELAWYAEYDKAPAAIMAHHHPDVPNLGDVTKVDWAAVPKVDVLTGGYPCQPFSHAGGRLGTDDPRHLWPYVAEAVGILRPALCVFENVRGHLSLGFDEVLRDLHLLGYSVRWYMLRAADVGAAHGRARIFIYAEDNHSERILSRPDRRGGLHRDPRGRWLISSAAESIHDRQRAVCASHDAQAPRGKAGELHAASRCSLPRDLHLEDDRPSGLCCDRSIETTAVSQGVCCGHCLGVSGDGGCITSASEWSGDMDRRDALSCRYVQEPDSEGEQKGSRPGCADSPRGKACGDLPARLVVGARGEPVRSDGVHGSPADVRANGCGSSLCSPGTNVGTPLTLLPTPAVNDMGAGKTVDAWDAWTARMQTEHGNGNRHGKSLAIEALRLLPTPTVSDSNGAGAHGDGGLDLRTQVSLLPTPTSSDAKASGAHGYGGNEFCTLTDATARLPQDWGRYDAAIRRQEAAFGVPAPSPTEPSTKGQPRLSPKFVEWLMAVPAGHVTDVPGISRNDQLKALGNGVSPPQAAAATRAFLHDHNAETAAV